MADPAGVAQVVEPAVHGICRGFDARPWEASIAGEAERPCPTTSASGSDCNSGLGHCCFANPVGAASLLCPDIIFGNRSHSDHQRCRRLHGPLCSLCARRHGDGDQHLQQLRRSRGIEQARACVDRGEPCTSARRPLTATAGPTTSRKPPLIARAEIIKSAHSIAR